MPSAVKHCSLLLLCADVLGFDNKNFVKVREYYVIQRAVCSNNTISTTTDVARVLIKSDFLK